MKKLTSFVSPAGASRLSDARALVLAIEPPILIIGASRAAADEFALSLAAEKTEGTTHRDSGARAGVPQTLRARWVRGGWTREELLRNQRNPRNQRLGFKQLSR